MTKRRERPPVTVRGYRMVEFCRREGIDRRTGWRWAEKGIVAVTRVAPRVGVRVRYVRDPDPV
jgi:hypothetical protein